jgi:hypothetical protein
LLPKYIYSLSQSEKYNFHCSLGTKLNRKKIFDINKKSRPGMVAHICNSTYLGDRDHENCGLRPAQAKSLHDPLSTNKSLAW